MIQRPPKSTSFPCPTLFRSPVRGPNDVARFVFGLVHKFQQGLLPALMEVNGAPPVALTDDAGGLRAVLTLQTDGERLTALDLVLNPEKLGFAQGQLSQMGGLSGLTG